MNTVKPTLWSAANELETAAYLMGNLHSLFTTLAKSDDRVAAGLARIGQGITEEWEGAFGESANKLLAEYKDRKAQQGGVQ